MRKNNSPEQKNAVIIDDDPTTQRFMKKALERIGWIVVGQATKLREALLIIEKIEGWRY